MKDEVKNEAGVVIRFRTKRMGVAVSRQQYGSGDSVGWSHRFYYAKMVNGILARFPLSDDPKTAEILADQIAGFLLDPTRTLTDAKKKFNPRALERPGDFSTVGDLFDYHREHWKMLELTERTGKGYQGNLMVILRHVDAFRKGTQFESWAGRSTDMDKLMEPWREKSLTLLTARLATDYQRLMVPADLEDEEEEITQKITCDTNLRGAHSLFSREAMRLYKQSETILIPDLTEFLAVSLFNAKKYFVLPPVSVIRNIFTAAPALKADDINAYRAFLLCVQAGMRKTEAANMRMAWLLDEDVPTVQIHADGKFKPKHGHGRKVLLDPWVGAELREIAGNDYVLSGTPHERGDDVFDRLNAWLRKCGVDSSKPTHELRKLWFSQKVKRESLLAAAQQGGHRDPKITTSFYASSQMPDNVLPFWQEPTLAALAHAGVKTA
jgi:integrase